MGDVIISSKAGATFPDADKIFVEDDGMFFDCSVNEDDLWMPIPTFDDILNSNKDVLKRLKER